MSVIPLDIAILDSAGPCLVSGGAVLKKNPPSSKASIAGDVADGEIPTTPFEIGRNR